MTFLPSGRRATASGIGSRRKRVVLLRARIAEKRHQPVAEPLQHMAAETGHCLRRLVEIGVDEVAPVFGVELGDKARRADEVEEQDGDRTALGGNFGTVRRRGLGRRRGNACGSCAGQCGDCNKQPAPIANRRDANIFEVVCRQPRQHVRVNLVVSELLLVLTEAEAAKPIADIHGRAPHGSTGYSRSSGRLSSLGWTELANETVEVGSF